MTRKAELRIMLPEELLAFTNTLSTKDWTKFTETDLSDIALYINSDGCSGVPDFYLDCCIIHDWFYATHRDFNGTPKTKKFADGILKTCPRKNQYLENGLLCRGGDIGELNNLQEKHGIAPTDYSIHTG